MSKHDVEGLFNEEQKIKFAKLAKIFLIIQIIFLSGLIFIFSQLGSRITNIHFFVFLVVIGLILSFGCFFSYQRLRYEGKFSGVIIVFLLIGVFYFGSLVVYDSLRSEHLVFLKKGNSVERIEGFELVFPFSSLEFFYERAYFDLKKENLKIKKVIYSDNLKYLGVDFGKDFYNKHKESGYNWWKNKSGDVKKQKILKFLKEKCVKKGDEYLCESKFFKNNYLLINKSVDY